MISPGDATEVTVMFPMVVTLAPEASMTLLPELAVVREIAP